MKKLITLFIAIMAIFLSGCTRISTGETGIRVGFDRQIQQGELMPGTFNQTIIGSVLKFPTKDITVDVLDMKVIAKDNSTMKDFDAMVIYSINPSMVSELYSNRASSFHGREKDGDTILMYHYVYQTARNAAYKAAREFEALDMNDNRSKIEEMMKESIIKTFEAEKLTSAITVTSIQVRQIVPADSVVQSANELVRAKNENTQKAVEVKTAELEAKRIAALNANSKAIEYMNAQSQYKIAEAVAAGKVSTIIVPFDFKGMISVK